MMDHYNDGVAGSHFEPNEVRASPYAPPMSMDNYHEPAPRRRKVLLPAVLFVATCFTTYQAGGPVFAAALMLILTMHELGHFFQALRYGVPASLPFFIPMPLSPTGTMGAVIGMQAHVGDRKALFDIGITGPIAGLIPTLVCCVVGLQYSEVVDMAGHQGWLLGKPLLFKLLSFLTFGPLGETEDILWHPLAFAGWVGIFITALNLIPIGQLDGGHVLYALLLRRAHRVSAFMLFAALLGVAIFGYWGWSVMLLLLLMMGPWHPPTADDTVPLGAGRTALGWLMLCFVFIGFTPQPFYVLGG